MVILGIEFHASRWPNQPGYDWKGMTNSRAPLDAGGARFGGGWRFALGVRWAEPSRLHFDLLFGCLYVGKAKKCPACNKWLRKNDKTGGLKTFLIPGEGHVYGWHVHRECVDKIEGED